MTDTEKFQLKDGRWVDIVLSDDTLTIEIFEHQAGQKVGEMRFDHIEGASDRGDDDYIRSTWSYMDLLDGTYKHQGIGRRCLQIIKECWDLPIIAATNDGRQREDGSHLTGDAPEFVARMVKEGLLDYEP